MSVALSQQNLSKWISDAIESFRGQDLVDLGPTWLRIYEALAEYLSSGKPADQNLLWMMEASEDAAADIVYRLQRLKNALVQAIVRENALEDLGPMLAWFDRTIVVIIEKTSGKLVREHSFHEPYETVFWNARDGMYISTVEGKFVYGNQALLDLLKLRSQEDLVELDIRTELYADPHDRQVMLEHLYRDGYFDRHEIRFQTANGEEKAALESCYLVNIPNGKRYIVGIMVDVTLERETQRKMEGYLKELEARVMELDLHLQSQNRRYEALLHLSENPVILVEPQHFHIKTFNQAFTRQFKMGKKASSKLSMRDLFTVDSWQKLFPRLAENLNRFHFHVRDLECVTQGSGNFIADIAVNVQKDNEGYTLFVHFQDRGEVSHYRHLLETVNSNWRNTLESVPVGLIGFRNDGSVAFVNRFVLDLLGFPNHELMDLSFMNALFSRDEQRLKFHKYIRQFMRGRHVDNQEIELNASNGQRLMFRLSTLPYHFEEASRPGFLAVLENITPQRALEQLERDWSSDPDQLRQENRHLVEDKTSLVLRMDELNARLGRRSAFLTTFVERVKAPIHLLLGYISYLYMDLQDQLKASSKEDLNIVREQIGGLRQMADTALEFLQLESGEISCQSEWQPARAFLDDLFPRLEALELPEGLELEATHQILSLDIGLETDPHFVEIMLRHLLDNAIGFSSKGRIWLTAYEDEKQLWLELRDVGKGIGPLDLPQVFEPFFTAGDRTRHSGEHLGLGLAIVALCAKRLGIPLPLIQSRQGQGTTVRIQLGNLTAPPPETAY